jgi:ubiquinone/menaquinone biosynthesis C-methylase UbiE
MPIDYDRIAAEYAQHRQVHPKVLENLISSARVSQASRVLDVGCGTGNYIRALHALTGCAGWGVDSSQEMLAQARQGAGGIRLQAGWAEQLGFATACFDLVFSVDVIHHVPVWSQYLAEAFRVLRPGGHLCTVTDSAWIIRHRVPLATHFPETVPLELARYPRIADVRRAMEQTGFGASHETRVEYRYSLSDIQAYRDRAFSALHLIAGDAFQRGMERLEEDLRRGPIACVSRYVLLWGTK